VGSSAHEGLSPLKIFGVGLKKYRRNGFEGWAQTNLPGQFLKRNRQAIAPAREKICHGSRGRILARWQTRRADAVSGSTSHF